MKYEELVKALRMGADYGVEEESVGKLCADAAAAIEELQAEVKRLKDANDELREAQTYIDHYGDKWMTSAKDVPTSAYNHGYADGRDEAEQALEPKRGEWILQASGQDCKCSACGAYWIPFGDEYDYKFCPNCGAKMEVQE